MKNKHLIPGILLLVAVIILLCIGLKLFPIVSHASHVSELLQPLLEADNQAMHISLSAEIDNETIVLESDGYCVADNDISYLVLDHNGYAVYIADNVLFLENGKAFKIGDAIQAQAASFIDLLPQIAVLYETLEITAEETENQTTYEITVTGEQVKPLLSALSLGESTPLDGIQKLTLSLAEKNEKLDQISFSGNANLNGKTVQFNATLSQFRLLAEGDYRIPEAVKHSAAVVDPDKLFNLTQDLYRLVTALIPFADMDTIEGTLDLTVDCGPLQLDRQFNLSDLKTSSDSQFDPEKLQALPGIVGWLCMEGEINCTENGNTYIYTLELDQTSMTDLSQMILPDLAQYAGDLTQGSVSIHLESEKITTMNVTIAGTLNALITKIPIFVAVEFNFD